MHDIDATSDHIRCDEHLFPAFTEPVDDLITLAGTYKNVGYDVMKAHEKIDDGLSFHYVKKAESSITKDKGFLGLYDVVDDEVRKRERQCTYEQLWKLPPLDAVLAIRFGTKGDEKDLQFDADRDGKALEFLNKYGLDSVTASERWTVQPVSWVPDLRKKAQRLRRKKTTCTCSK